MNANHSAFDDKEKTSKTAITGHSLHASLLDLIIHNTCLCRTWFGLAWSYLVFVKFIYIYFYIP